MKKQQLIEQPFTSRRRFLKTLAAGTVGMVGGWALLATATTQTASPIRNPSRAFSASATINIEAVNKFSSGRQAV